MFVAEEDGIAFHRALQGVHDGRHAAIGVGALAESTGVAAPRNGDAGLPILLDLLLAEAVKVLAQGVAVCRGFVPNECHHASLQLLIAFSRFRLALDRQVAEQNRSRFVPQIAVPQESHVAGFATIGFWQWGQRLNMARRLARFANAVKRFVAKKPWRNAEGTLG
jgi:hypothetical protein